MASLDLVKRRLFRLLLEGATSRLHADTLAARLGFGTRHQLNQATVRLGLPSAGTLLTLIRVTGLIRAARAARRSVCDEAIRHGVDPAWVYRAIRQLTGAGWSSLRDEPVRRIVRRSLVRHREERRQHAAGSVAWRLRQTRQARRSRTAASDTAT